MPDLVWLTPALFTNAGNAAVFAGVDPRRRWWVRSVAGDAIARQVLASDPGGAMMLLPLMQPGYGGAFHDVLARFEGMLDAAGLPRELIETFPFYGPVLLAYGEMSGWAEWAQAWMGDVPLGDDQVFALSDLLQSEAIAQRARHAAMRRVRQWERERGISIVRRPKA